jgi:hypothetical protein
MKTSMKKRIEGKKRVWHDLIDRKIFSPFMEDPEQGIEEICKNIDKYWDVVRCYCEVLQKEEGDYRHGYLTYGYENLDSIRSNLMYISDRFGAAFRLAWLLNVPMEVANLYLGGKQSFAEGLSFPNKGLRWVANTKPSNEAP